MNFDVIGLHPDNTLKVALQIFDNKPTVDEKIKVLLNNRPIKDLNSIDLPPNFKSGKTIDLNTSELLGIGCVASYYNWLSEEADTKNTYQAIVGIEDSAKQQIESLLSDGAVWHDQAGQKMLAQQVMVQGYFPKKSITNDDVIAAIKKKNNQRASYPDNCMLIVNIFGEAGAIDRQAIYAQMQQLTDNFTDVYVVVYNLPLLTYANVSYVSEPLARGLTIELKRHDYEDEWRFNHDGKQRKFKN
jgi:hypothetical protein